MTLQLTVENIGEEPNEKENTVTVVFEMPSRHSRYTPPGDLSVISRRHELNEDDADFSTAMHQWKTTIRDILLTHM